MKIRIVLLISFIFLITPYVLAAYDDYVRDYSVREDNTTAPILFFILICVALWGLYKIIYYGVSKLDDLSKKDRNTPIKIKQELSDNNQFVNYQICKHCYGSGEGEGYDQKDVTNMSHKCQICNGVGYVETETEVMLTLREKIKNLKLMIKQKHDDYILRLKYKCEKQSNTMRRYCVDNGIEFLSFEEASKLKSELLNNIHSSLSYKNLKRYNSFINKSTNAEDISLTCMRIIPCLICSDVICKRYNISLKNKKLKIQFDRENRMLIQKYFDFLTMYRMYFIPENRASLEKSFRSYSPFYKLIKKDKDNLSIIESQLNAEINRNRCKCTSCGGHGVVFDDANLELGKNVMDIPKQKTSQKMDQTDNPITQHNNVVNKFQYLAFTMDFTHTYIYYKKKKCPHCNGRGYITTN